MIDRIKNDTSVFNAIFNSILSTQKPSHAYLFELCNDDSYDDVYNFMKMLLCPKRDKNFISDVCSECSMCRNIDENNCLNLKIISPCNGLIKKEDILNVQRFFATKSLNNEIRIYLIKDCDKMNASASNSLLKFLEEPNENVIAILTTYNVEKVLPTIISRCQTIRIGRKSYLGKDTVDNLYKSINNGIIEKETFKSLFSDSFKVIDFLNRNGTLTIVYLNELWGNHLVAKNVGNDSFKLDNMILLDIMICFYYDILKLKMNYNGDLYFLSDLDKLEEISFNLTIDKTLNILYILFKAKDNIDYNVNLNLFFDKLIIDVSEGLEK